MRILANEKSQKFSERPDLFPPPLDSTRGSAPPPLRPSSLLALSACVAVLEQPTQKKGEEVIKTLSTRPRVKVSGNFEAIAHDATANKGIKTTSKPQLPMIDCLPLP